MKKQQEDSARIDLRLSSMAKNRIQWLADMYAGGSMTKWIVYASLNCNRKFIVPNKDISEPKKKARASAQA
jgi:hypothetical protein